jgi:hypothetical protein
VTVYVNIQTILKLLFKVYGYPTNLYYFIILKDIQTILKLPFKVNGYSTERDRAASAAVGDKMVVLGGRDNDGQVIQKIMGGVKMFGRSIVLSMF